MRRLSALLIGVCALALAGAADAGASWQAGGSAPAYARAETMPAGSTPLAGLSEGSVTVSWTAANLAGGGAPEGYVVRRYAASGEEVAIGAGCAGTIAALSCTEAAVPPGRWRYTVTPVLQGWRGAESAASATVAVPVTIATSAWDLRDASSGVEENASEPTAFAADGRTYETHSFDREFSPGRYVEWTYDSPLEAGVATSSVSFDFRFAAAGAKDVACFHFEVVSGGVTIGSHGALTPEGAGSPRCTGSAYKLVSTPLPEVTSSNVANGLRIKVYGYESSKKPILVDEATVSGTAAPAQAFTLHETALVDAASGKGETTAPWTLATAGDGAVYASAGKWPSAFSASRYLLLSFPSYVPAGDAVSGISFVHSYRSTAGGGNVCWYFEVYAGGSLIGSHGSAVSPVSCNGSTSSFVTDTVPLPEVTTAAQADALAIKMSVDSAGTKQSEHDLAQLQIGYVP